MMLDLSAAFDMVDHDLLLRILMKEIGRRGTVLQWFTSFLKGLCTEDKTQIYHIRRDHHQIWCASGVCPGPCTVQHLYKIDLQVCDEYGI